MAGRAVALSRRPENSRDRMLLPRFLYRGLRARLRDQRAELRALISAIRPGDTVLDIGAHKGSYLLWLSRAVGPGRVVAFEPQPGLADYLRRASRAASLNNVTVEAAGVSDRSGRLSLHVPGEGDSPGASFEAAIRQISVCRDLVVPVFSLDEYFREGTPRISAIKVDAEGHELRVFQGAEEILRRHRPLLVFECEGRHLTHGSVDDVLRFLEERGYTGFFVRRSRLLPIREFDPETHQSRIGDRFWDAKDYCNNFIMHSADRGVRSPDSGSGK